MCRCRWKCLPRSCCPSYCIPAEWMVHVFLVNSFGLSIQQLKNHHVDSKTVVYDTDIDKIVFLFPFHKHSIDSAKLVFAVFIKISLNYVCRHCNGSKKLQRLSFSGQRTRIFVEIMSFSSKWTSFFHFYDSIKWWLSFLCKSRYNVKYGYRWDSYAHRQKQRTTQTASRRTLWNQYLLCSTFTSRLQPTTSRRVCTAARDNIIFFNDREISQQSKHFWKLFRSEDSRVCSINFI